MFFSNLIKYQNKSFYNQSSYKYQKYQGMKAQKDSDITSKLFKYLVENRQKLVEEVQKSSDEKMLVNNLMLMMGRTDCYDYVEEMAKRKFKKHFKELMGIEPDISQSAYVKRLEDVYKGLMEQFAEDEENPNLTTQLSALITKIVVSQKKQIGIQKSQLKMPNGSNLEKSVIKADDPIQPNPQRSFIKSGSNKLFNQIKPNLPIDRMESSLLRIQQPIQRVEEPKFDPLVKNIKSKDLNVVVRYFSQTFDYNYGYGNREIKKQMSIAIRNFLAKNPVSFKRVANSIRIMEDISIVKSEDAGNYYFDPFCQSVEIKIQRKDKKQFNNDFQIEGDLKELQISEEKVDNITLWNKVFLKLNAKDDLKALVDYIGEKRQQSQQERNSLIQGLKKKGGANTIQDLFNWSSNSYQKIGVKPTWMYEIQQTIEIIKDNSKSGTEKSFSQKKRDCLKIANSHKILRYLVYKNYNMQEVLKLPWLNMKNVKKSIDIVKDQIHNSQLLNQLEKYFDQFALDPKDDPIPYSRGLVLYGPPGTGKTVLTQAMPNIMGFHLISKGLSAADFMKSLVGQSSRMIRDLVNRANECPYLLCSVGIDEVDGLVPDRKDKDEKNKGEGISMLLSVIGGNKDVSNLVFMTSTNYLKKIDEAIRRRLSGQYQVGRPNPEQRKKIILSQVSYLKSQEQLLNHLILITTNFTGASLKGISNQLNKILRTKQMENKPITLVEDEVTDAAILMARQFSITLGVYTLPEIYKNQTKKKNLFTKKFLSRVTDNLLVVQHLADNMKAKNKFILMYANKVVRYHKGNKQTMVEKEEQKFFLQVQEGRQFEDFQNYLKNITKNKIITIRSNNCKNNNSVYRRNIKQVINNIPNKSKEPTLVLIEDFIQSEDENVRTANALLDSRKNIHCIFYMTPYSASSSFFTQLYGKSVDYQAKLNYTGRIFVELNDEARMAFELNRAVDDESKVAFKLFLKSQQSNSPKNVIPELVNFFTKQQVSYILLLDYELLLQNDAFEEKKMLEIMEQKMTQAKNYDKVAVIINVDSLITMSENASDSNFGRSMSYSVVNHNMYQILINYMSQFAMVNQSVNKWVSIVIKNQELVKKVKKDLNWPLYPEEQTKQKQEQEKDKEKQCGRCGMWFTERKNKQERACMQHPGKIVDMKTGQFEQEDPDSLLGSVTKQKMKNKGKDQNKQKQEPQERYKWTCCKKNITEDGHQPYYHITENLLNTEEDDLYMERLKKEEVWDRKRQQMC